MKKISQLLFFGALMLAFVTGCTKDDPEAATELTLSDSAFTDVTYEGATLTLTIASNSDWAVTNIPAWCTVTPQSGNGNGTVSITVQANDGDARQATINITAKEVSRECTIEQEAMPAGPVLHVNLTEFRGIKRAGESLTLQIVSNIDWTITDIPAWCTITPQSGNGNAAVMITVSENNEDNTREATIKVSGGTFNHPIFLSQLSGKMIMPDKTMRTWLAYYDYITIVDTNTGEFTLTDKGKSTTSLGPDADSSYAGLEHFPNLKEIKFFGGTERMRAIKKLDFRAFRGLEKIIMQGAHGLQTLKTENLPNLKVVQIINSVKETEKSLTDLTLYNCPNLDSVVCNGARLTALDLTGLSKLRVLEIYNNNIAELMVSNCPQLEELKCYENNLSALDVSKNIRLNTLQCRNNKLATLDVNKNIELKWLSCGSNQFTTLDISKLAKLEYLYCENSSITELNLSQCPYLKYFDCSKAALNNVNLSNKASLISLDCYGMPNLDTLNISGCNALTMIGLTHPNLNGRNAFTATVGLFDLGTYNGTTPPFKTLIANNWSILKVVTCSANNKVTSLSFKYSTALKTITLTNNSNLKYLYLTGVTPTTYNVSGNHPDFQRIDN